MKLTSASSLVATSLFHNLLLSPVENEQTMVYLPSGRASILPVVYFCS